jgi:hypothetical protein
MKNLALHIATALSALGASAVILAPAVAGSSDAGSVLPREPLGREEFLKQAGARFDSFDLNGDGKLDRSELRAARESRTKLRPVKFQMPEEFKHVDWSRD